LWGEKVKDTCAVILAAGDGKRMCLGRVKIFCEVLFKPLICWVFENCKQTGISDICLVCSKDGLGRLKDYFGSGAKYVIQEEKLGSAHAAAQAESFLRSGGKKDVLILLGDVPFVDAKTIADAYVFHESEKNEVTVIAANLENPFGYGRIVDDSGRISIVEEKDATQEQRKISLVNSGAMWFRIEALLSVLDKIDNNNASNEYYITTAVNLLSKSGCYIASASHVILGANTNEQLLHLNEVARGKIIAAHNQNGVEFLSESGVVIGPEVQIGKDTRIFQNVTLKGKCQIGERCVITPGSFIENATIGNDCEIRASYIEDSRIADGVRIGPFAHIRPGCDIGDAVKIGNYVEIKKSVIGNATSIAHLSYVGDCEVGSKVTFGCGSIVVNYDGKNKYKTKVEAGAFVGCNSNLISPVNIGKDSFIAAGSTITDDVGEGDLAIARARQVTKPGYLRQKRGNNNP
jgi:bifunctional UDP-N-acetylglucosamine pyrophosphorylase/glucosamine-1-phosphate N-acetyltransferase